MEEEEEEEEGGGGGEERVEGEGVEGEEDYNSTTYW